MYLVRGRLLLNVVIFFAMVAVVLVMAVLDAFGGDSFLNFAVVGGAVTTGTAGQIVTEVGRRRGGRIGAPWIGGLIALALAVLVMGAFAEAFTTRALLYRVAIALCMLSVVVAAPSVVLAGVKGRLGAPRASQTPDEDPTKFPW